MSTLCTVTYFLFIAIQICGSAHFYSTEYIVVDTKMNWQEAETYCNTIFSTHLASLHSTENNDELTDLFTGKAYWVWIGMNDFNMENEFEWSDGSVVDYTKWGPSEPNNAQNEDCATITNSNDNPSKTWNDNKCAGDKAFACNHPLRYESNNSTVWKLKQNMTITPIPGSKYGKIQLKSSMYLKFRFRYNGISAADTIENVFKIGVHNISCTNYPGLATYNNALHFVLSSSTDCQGDTRIPPLTLTPDTIYSFIMDYDDTTIYIVANYSSTINHIIYDGARLSPNNPLLLNQLMDVIISGVNVVASDVTLLELLIISYEGIFSLYPTVSPTYLPSRQPTPSPILVGPSSPYSPIVGSINCGETVYGQTTDTNQDGNQKYYQFTLDSNIKFLQFKNCGSRFDTEINLYFYNDTGWMQFDHHDAGQDECKEHDGYNEIMNNYNVQSGDYYVGITGYDQQYGWYELEMICNITHYQPLMSAYGNFILINFTATYSVGNTFCNEIYGTDLASIHSQQENDEITTLCNDNTLTGHWVGHSFVKNTSECWIGLVNSSVSHVYEWEDGSNVDYMNTLIAPIATGYRFECVRVGSWTDSWIISRCEGNDQAYYPFICNGVPTMEPTYVPSAMPTVQPTYIPTVMPTILPTILPTAFPTYNPTITPSDSTLFPSYTPTNIPTCDPTTDPTIEPTIIPSLMPTIAPTKSADGGVVETTGNSSRNYNTEMEKDESSKSAGYMVVTVVLSVCGLLIFCAVIMVVIAYRKRKMKEEKGVFEHEGVIDVSPSLGHNNVNGASSPVSTTEMIQTKNNAMEMGISKINSSLDRNNDDDLLEDINKTDMGVDQRNDEEIIEMINQTDIGNPDDNNETDMGNNKQPYNDEDIVSVVNNTNIGASVDTVKDYNVTKYEINDKRMENGEKNEIMEGVEYDMDEDGAKQVNVWLDSIGFSKYYDNFVQNGFDSMEFIKQINSENDLNDIGIALKAHRLTIINHLNALKH